MPRRVLSPALVVTLLGSTAYAVRTARDVREAGNFGVDFGVFHAGGAVISDRGFAAAYDPERFTATFTRDYYPSLADEATVAHFISTPPFGWLMQVVAMVPFEPALALWTVAGLGLTVAIVRSLGVSGAGVALALVGPAVVTNVLLGQSAALVLLLVVAMHRRIVAHDRLGAGLLGGLLVLKPMLAVGYAMWWLVRAREWRGAIAAALASGALLSAPTVVGGLDAWRGFYDAIRHRADIEGVWMQQSSSLPEFLKLLFPAAGTTGTLAFWALGAATGLLFVVAAARRLQADAELMSAVAVVAAVWASPHLLVYDLLVLALPLAVLLRRGLLSPERALTLVALNTAAIAVGPELYQRQVELFERGIGLEAPALALSVYLATRWASDEAAATEAGLSRPSTEEVPA